MTDSVTNFTELCKHRLATGITIIHNDYQASGTGPQSFENYTPMTITVQKPNGEGELSFPSKGVARVTESQVILGEHAGVEIRQTTYEEIVGLPEPIEGVKYIVSIVVTQANARLPNPRYDLVSPDTGKSCIRDEKGMIKAVTGFTL